MQWQWGAWGRGKKICILQKRGTHRITLAVCMSVHMLRKSLGNLALATTYLVYAAHVAHVRVCCGCADWWALAHLAAAPRPSANLTHSSLLVVSEQRGMPGPVVVARA